MAVAREEGLEIVMLESSLQKGLVDEALLRFVCFPWMTG